MKLLLDTNALIWWMEDNPNLGPRARQLIADRANDVFVSIASPWEISIKYRIEKMEQCGSAILNALGEEKMTVLGITSAHLEALEGLPRHHRDPFDHIILAQAKVEGARIITSDRIMTAYGVPCIGVS